MSTANTTTLKPQRNRGVLRDGLFIKSAPSYYSPSQASQWLDCIGFPQKFDVASFPSTLENLAHLVRLHLVAFPFENTAMHYTPHHTMDVTHEGAFRRLVLEHKGSYCFGQNGVFLGMLRALGYRAYSGAARVNSTPESLQPSFTSLSHMVIFVQPIQDSNETYVVDVGFGSTGLARPILLSDANDNVVMGTWSTEKHRLTRSPHPSSSLEISEARSTDTNFLWNLEVLHCKEENIDTPWKLLFSFTEDEYYPVDYENASFVLTHKPEGIFWTNVLCIRYVPLSEAGSIDAETKAQIDLDLAQRPAESSKDFLFKYVMRGLEVKRSIGSSSVVIRTLTSEAERIRALREIFNLDIPDAAETHMEGRGAAFLS
ncbi:hypothetical protein BDZ94DRAFT_1157039 [Collybia nuda]|uniref:Arylamine N-acetyltransferase n=1 Tax=Collybia nuda TaxID=64659 RepID=A0A9P6CI26_9AGAR|nr:hypothetical protein BDZ94DRAFT_1157039 [Collybia nuda]